MPPIDNLELAEFQTFTEFIDMAEFGKSVHKHANYSREESSFGENMVSFDAAVKLAREGWPEGTANITKLVSVYVDKLTSLIVQPQVRFDVTGLDFDMGLHVSGQPESWYYFENEIREGVGFKHVRIVHNYAASGSVSAQQITRKGAATAGLVQLLELTGIRVELVAVDTITEHKGDKLMMWESRVTLKKADEMLDVDRVAFALTNQAMLRRLTFSLIEQAKNSNWLGYGRPVESESKGDIYIPANFSFGDDQSAQTWIIEQLKSQGVHLTSDKEQNQ